MKRNRNNLMHSKKIRFVYVYIRQHLKPNSGLRKVAKIQLSNNRKIIAQIPGIGHNLQEHSCVLVVGRLEIFQGSLYDTRSFRCKALMERKTRRSKYGTKRS
jgi:small subunit ribosomal protein S12